MNFWLDLSREDEVGVDTETTGFERTSVPVGCSITTSSGQKRYYRWGHERGGNNCSLAEFIRWARVEFNHSQVIYAFFNPLYDLRMFTNIGVEVGGIIKSADAACALLNEYEPEYTLEFLSDKYVPEDKKLNDQALWDRMAELFGGKASRDGQGANIWRAPGDWIEPYAESDSTSTLKLLQKKEPELYLLDDDENNLAEIWQTETMLLPVLHRMWKAGVKIDKDRAEEVQAVLDHEYQISKVEWDQISGGFKFSEKNKMVALLDRLGIHYPRHKPTAAMLAKGITIGNPRLDKYFLEELAELGNPLGQLIMGMRQNRHYRDVFIQNYLLNNLAPGDRIYPNFWPTRSAWGGTITGRFSSSGGLNAQNIPARDERWAPLIRSMFIPYSEDHQWLRCDYSQIEYRFFAHFAGGNMRKAYNDNPDTDFHQFVMDTAGLKRKDAKNLNFAKLYGAGVAKVALMLGVSEEEAQEFIDKYDTKIPEAKKLINRAMNRASVRGYIRTWGGRTLRFKKQFGRYMNTFTALNKLLQGSSANLTKMAMIAVDQLIDYDETIMHLTVHDELDFSVSKGSAGVKKARELKEIMESFELTVPIKVEAELGPDWGHCEPLDKAA